MVFPEMDLIVPTGLAIDGVWAGGGVATGGRDAAATVTKPASRLKRSAEIPNTLLGTAMFANSISVPSLDLRMASTRNRLASYAFAHCRANPYAKH
jgi:hypothetical protein